MTFDSNPLSLTLRLVRQRRPLFIGTSLLWTLVHVLPVLTGIFTKGVFDALSGLAPAGLDAWSFLALALALDVSRIGLFVVAIRTWASYWAEITLHLRHNLLSHLLLAAGARRLAESPSESVTRFRDDVNDVGEYVENWVDFWGLAAYGVVALSVMALIDPLLTLLACVPLMLTLGLTSYMRPLIRDARRRSREATSRVTDFLGETFGSVQAVKASGREASVLARFSRLNETRRERALKDTVLTELFRSVTDNMVHVATGIVLLVGAASLRDGSFTVGDFALFVTYLPRLTGVMSFVGLMFVQHKRTGVAYERLGRVMVDGSVEDLVAVRDHGLERRDRPFVADAVEAEPLQSLEVAGITCRHPSSGEGVFDVSFTVARGEFVVVTGRVGSGKSTLVRALLGLLPIDAGEVRWNGRRVEDPASFFVPPRSAYTSQVPRLFSDSLRENVLLGREADARAVDAALDLAVLGPDVAALHGGLDTEVGTRGVRLSGGQVQRAAAARMFLSGAELLVFDDLSSALDVDTERRLWDGLFATGDVTCLVVSHRRAALERADKVLVLERGRVAAYGTFEEVALLVPELLELGAAEGAETSAPGVGASTW